jgi:serine/threonine protein phosphatase PrpC
MKKYWMFGVFDGHGSNGHKVSHFIKKKLPEGIVNRFLHNYEAHINQKSEGENITSSENLGKFSDDSNLGDNNN